MTRCGLVRLVLLSALMLSPFAHGARALLVGVGNYADERLDLPGIAADIVNMRQALQYLGYADADIRVLMDHTATRDAILAGLNDWLSGEDALFYFSGHGVQVPDLDGDEGPFDGFDEALAPYDTLVGLGDGEDFGRVILDDEISAWLAGRVGLKTTLIFDACHGGGAARNGSRALARLLENGHPLDGVPADAVLMAATSADAPSQADITGSPFTTTWTHGVRELARRGVRSISIHEFHRQYLDSSVLDSRLRPTLRLGSRRAADTFEIDSGALPAPFLQSQIAMKLGHSLPVFIPRGSFRSGEPIPVSVRLPADGWLRVVAIDERDNVVQLFPGPLDHEVMAAPGSGRYGRVDRGHFQLGRDGGIAVRAAPPAGQVSVVASFLGQRLPGAVDGVFGMSRMKALDNTLPALSPSEFIAGLGLNAATPRRHGVAGFHVTE